MGGEKGVGFGREASRGVMGKGGEGGIGMDLGKGKKEGEGGEGRRGG